MHKSKQNQKNTENQITSFNDTSLDPSKLVQIDELDDASLAEVVGGIDRCWKLVCTINDICQNKS
jgi:hypothetical protein